MGGVPEVTSVVIGVRVDDHDSVVITPGASDQVGRKKHGKSTYLLDNAFAIPDTWPLCSSSCSAVPILKRSARGGASQELSYSFGQGKGRGVVQQFRYVATDQVRTR